MKQKKYDLVLYKDQYNIYNLITKIDKGYRLYFDRKSKLFIIAKNANFLQICCKTAILSPNMLNSLQKSRIENLQKIVREIDDFNEDLLQKNRERLKKNITDKMVDFVTVSKRASNISKQSINKIIGE